MKVAITGRQGQLAQGLAERAQQHLGLSLIFLARPEVDLEKPGSIRSAILQTRPDVVINAAAYTAVDQAEQEPDRAQRINGDAAGEAAQAAQEIGAPIIQLSTDYVFDGNSRAPYRETDPVSPLGVYGRTKLSGEEQVRGATPRHVIVRTAWVYSPFGRNFVKSMMTAARTRDRLTVVDDQQGSPTSAFDLADAILTLLERWRGGASTGHGETYHIGGQGVASWCTLATVVMAECHRLRLPTAEVLSITTQDWPTAATRPTWSVLDSSKFETLIGWTMPPWQQSVTEVVERIAANSDRS